MRMYCNVAPAAAAPCCAGASSPRRVHCARPPPRRPAPEAAPVHAWRHATFGCQGRAVKIILRRCKKLRDVVRNYLTISYIFNARFNVKNMRAYLHDRASAAGTRARETNMIPPGGVRGTSCGAASRDPLLSLVPLASRERRVEVVLA